MKKLLFLFSSILLFFSCSSSDDDSSDFFFETNNRKLTKQVYTLKDKSGAFYKKDITFFTYDEGNNLTQTILKSEFKYPESFQSYTETTFFSYHPNGLLKKTEKYITYPDNPKSSFSVQEYILDRDRIAGYTYDSSGNITEYLTKDTKSEYKNNNLSKVIYYELNGEVRQVTIHEYDLSKPLKGIFYFKDKRNLTYYLGYNTYPIRTLSNSSNNSYYDDTQYKNSYNNGYLVKSEGICNFKANNIGTMVSPYTITIDFYYE